MRYTLEQVEDLLDKLNKSTVEATNKMEQVDTAYIEKPDGSRFSITSYRSPKIYDLKVLEKTCKTFVNNINKELSSFDCLYIGSGWSLNYVSPSHIDPYTFDYTENPSESFWMLEGRFRGLNDENK